MSRSILLIGRGPLPTADAPQLGFSQLRTRHFLHALRAAGHNPTVGLLVPEEDAHVSEPGIVPIVEEGPGWLDALAALADEADLIIGAGPYNPSRAACLVAREQPVWADIPGDPFSELQALALAMPGAIEEEQCTAAQSGALSVLARADAISTCSGPQRHATLGQLGLLGRLTHPEGTPAVHVLPIAADFALPGKPPRSRAAGDPLVLALSGAFNPWFDDVLAAEALELALDACPQLRVVCTGGGIEGFYTAGYERFSRWAAGHPDRVTLHGWVPHGQLSSILHGAHVGLSLDRDGLEPELGSRTRLLLFAHMGLLPISTVRCELSQRWVAADALVPLRERNASGIAAVLTELVGSDAPIARIERAATLCRTQAAPLPIAAPLIAWVDAPRRTRPVNPPQVAMAQQLDRHRAELGRIYGSPTWQVMDRLRALSRLGRG